MKIFRQILSFLGLKKKKPVFYYREEQAQFERNLETMRDQAHQGIITNRAV